MFKTIPELSVVYGISEDTIRSALYRGLIDGRKVGRDWVIDDQTDKYKEWLKAREYQPRVKGEQKKRAEAEEETSDGNNAE